MLGLLLIFFIGKWFYRLALDYNKNECLFAVLGILSFFTGGLFYGISITIIGLLTHSNIPNTISMIVLDLLLTSFGLIGCCIFHKQLVLQWNKQPSVKEADSLDGSVMK